jgi:hypothetical protein
MDFVDSATNAFSVSPATSLAKVVLPTPGGPHKTTELKRSASINARSGRPLPSR